MAVKPDKKRISISLREDKLKLIQEIAREEDLTVSQFMTRASLATISRMKPNINFEDLKKK